MLRARRGYGGQSPCEGASGRVQADAQRHRSNTADQAAARHANPVATAPATGVKSLATGTIVLARALANDPPLILADEPTANLDSAIGRDVARLLRQLATKDDRAVVIVSHDSRLEEVADRVLWLEDGTFRELATMATDPVCGMAVPQHDHPHLGGTLGGGVGANPALQLDAFGVGDRKGWHGRHAAAPQAASLRSPHMSETNAELH